ncbi:MAG: hypothetical protein Q9183_000711 [Haloplaca sp. 2 TL-2023]
MPSSEALTDDYLARLLAKDAQDRTIKYSSYGLQSSIPKRPTTNAPKPNTRFLKNIIKETDSHNAALKAKEAADARARLRNVDRENEWNYRSERSEKRQRRIPKGKLCSRLAGPSDVQDYQDARGGTDVKGENIRTTAVIPQTIDAIETVANLSIRDAVEAQPRMHQGISTERADAGGQVGAPPWNLTGADTEDQPGTDIMAQPHRLESTTTALVGATAHHHFLPNGHLPRGRGALHGSSAIDSHFAPNYNPSRDTHAAEPATTNESDDWDNALEALRDRERWKANGAERLRAAGFTDDQIGKWERSGHGGEKVEKDVVWKGRGEGREWDRGKVVSEEGISVRPVEWGRLKGT